MQPIENKEFKFKFNPNACQECEGKCCTGESGYIWVTPDEMQAISERLGLAFDVFTKEYVKKVGYRYSLIEKKVEQSYECIFFDTKLKQCGIYEQRPLQCRTFPFWDSFKDDISEVVKECPGIIVS